MIYTERFRVNKPKVINEIIDGEAIIVNLDNGNYYSTDKVGALIWGFLENGLAKQQIVDVLAQEYSGCRDAIAEGVSQMITQMQHEGLVVPDQDCEQSGNGPIGQSHPQEPTLQNGEKPSFEVPVLHKYNDMQDLLLLDPIHDVDETGWPNTNPHTSSL
jgi:hypothetical protein